MKLNNYFFLYLFLFFGITIALAQEKNSFREEAKKQRQQFLEEANQQRQNFVKGWDNNFFSEDILSSQPANTEAIDIENNTESNEISNNTYKLPSTVTSKVKLWAIVIGVSNYEAINKLNYADDDAQRFARFLASPEGGAIPEERLFILVDEDANYNAVHKTIEKVYGSASKNDGVILYFSGHGGSSAFVLPEYNATRKIEFEGKMHSIQIKNKGLLTHNYLNQQIESSKAKYKYCIIDACHSASMVENHVSSIEELATNTNFYADLNKKNQGSVFLLSSKKDEVSYENRNQKFKLRGGYFTYFLMEGIKGAADYNKDRIITVVEAFNYCKVHVNEVTKEKQNPVISGQYSHQMPIGVIRK